jgi:hypothetical protein
MINSIKNALKKCCSLSQKGKPDVTGDEEVSPG